ncbi:hypothetical protein DIPPA_25464 [Diplonema papillatum]|nr:hypothetical protein DIPPA_25464 [Diplonema papillatum]
MASSDLKQYKNEYPGMLAFADVDTPHEDPTVTREERALEFDLEKTIDRIHDAVRVRRELYSSFDAKPQLPAGGEVKGIREWRAERARLLDAVGAAPTGERPSDRAEAMVRELQATTAPKNTVPLTVATLESFYKAEALSLEHRRSRLLFRWARYCNGADLLTRAHVLLATRLHYLAEEQTHAAAALRRLAATRRRLEERQAAKDKAQRDARPSQVNTRTVFELAGMVPLQDQQPEGGDAPPKPAPEAAAPAEDSFLMVDPSDVVHWLNSTSFTSRTRRRFSRFAVKARWLAVHRRWELFHPVHEHIVAQAAQASSRSAHGGYAGTDPCGDPRNGADGSGAASPEVDVMSSHKGEDDGVGGGSLSPAAAVPLLPLTDDEIAAPLEEVTACFRLQSACEDHQEFMYRAQKKFTGVFSAQNHAFSLLPYSLAPGGTPAAAHAHHSPHASTATAARPTRDAVLDAAASTPSPTPHPSDEVQDSSAGPSSKAYLVHAPWVSRLCGMFLNPPQPPAAYQQVMAHLSNKRDAPEVDAVLSTEAGFLQETDVQYVLRRLKEQVATHMDRALTTARHQASGFPGDVVTPNSVSRGLATGGGAMDTGEPHDLASPMTLSDGPASCRKEGDLDGSPPHHGNPAGYPPTRSGAGLGQGGPAAHKRHALYLLRYVRTRAFRRRLLEVLNYFSSIERRLALDAYGYTFGTQQQNETRQDVAGGLAQFPSGDDPKAAASAAFAQSIGLGSGWDPAAGLASAAQSADSFARKVQQFYSVSPEGPAEVDKAARAASQPQQLSNNQPGLETREDTYRVTGKSVTVIDSLGNPIVYDYAFKKLSDLEADMLRIGTHYVAKCEAAKATKAESSGATGTESNADNTEYDGSPRRGHRGRWTPGKRHKGQAESAAGPSGIEADVDKVAVLEALYECETWYGISKKKVVDCLLEAYEHATAPVEQKRIAEAIMKAMSARPLLDLDDDYFTASYTAETVSLELTYTLFRDMINGQIADEKRVVASYHSTNAGTTGELGLTLQLGAPQQPPSDTKLYQCLFPGASVANVLDFHSSLSVIAEVIPLVDEVVSVVYSKFAEPIIGGTTSQSTGACSASVSNGGNMLKCKLRQKVLQQLYIEWKLLVEEERLHRQLQGGGSSQILDSDAKCVLDDASSTHVVIQEILRDNPQALKKVQDRDRLVGEMWLNVVDATTNRTALIEMLYETELLFNVHKKQAAVMGIDVRKMQFEQMDFETKKAQAEFDEPLQEDLDADEIVSLRTEYLTNLAISEFEHAMGNYDFHSTAGTLKILTHSLGDLRRAVTVQAVQRNLLVASALYNQHPIDFFYHKVTHQAVEAARAKVCPQQKANAAEGTDDWANGTTNEAGEQWGQRRLQGPGSPLGVRQGALRKTNKAGAGKGGSPAAEKPEPAIVFPSWITDSFLSQDELKACFLSVNHFKSAHRRSLLESLNTATADLLRSRHPELLRKQMKELKRSLIHEYCIAVTAGTLPYLYRYEAAALSYDVKKTVARLPGVTESLIRIGSPEDTVEMTATGIHQHAQHRKPNDASPSVTGRCLLAADGRVEDPWYVPHYVQIYRQPAAAGSKTGLPADHAADPQTAAKWSPATHTVEPADSTAAATQLRHASRILHFVRSLLAFCEVLSWLQSAASTNADDPPSATQFVAKELKKLQAELEPVEDLADASSLLHSFEKLRDVVFLRVYLALSSVKQSLLTESFRTSDPATRKGKAPGQQPYQAAGTSRSVVFKKAAATVIRAIKQMEFASCRIEFLPCGLPTVATLTTARAMGLDPSGQRDYEELLKNLCPAFAPPAGVREGLFARQGHSYEGKTGLLGLAEEASPVAWLDGFLVGLSGDDRRHVATELAAQTHFLSEVKSDVEFVEEVMDGGLDNMPVHDPGLGALKAQAAALVVTTQREVLKTYYCTGLQQLDQASFHRNNLNYTFFAAPGAEVASPALSVAGEHYFLVCDESFLKMISSKARAQYENEAHEGTDGGDDQARRQNGKKRRTETALRRKQVTVLRQEINRHHLSLTTEYVKQVLEQVNGSVVSLLEGTADDGAAAFQATPSFGAEAAGSAAGSLSPASAKNDIFADFHVTVMARMASTRQEGVDYVTYHIPAPVLGAAIDEVARKVSEWGAGEVRTIARTSEFVLQQHRLAVFRAEQKILQLQRLRDVDAKALARRVASKLGDEKHDLVFQKNTLARQNEALRSRLANIERSIRGAVKAEYEEVVTELQKEIKLLRGRFGDHRKKLYREIQVNLEEIKRHAMMSIGKSDVAPLHMKRQALKIAIGDEEVNKLKERNTELQITLAKLKLWSDVRIANVHSEASKTITRLEKERDEASKRYWEGKEQVEEREGQLQQQLRLTQKNLTVSEMEVEHLLRDLDLQEKKKKHLVAWKVAHAKQLEDLTHKAKKLERYEKLDVDRLLRNLEKAEDREQAHAPPPRVSSADPAGPSGRSGSALGGRKPASAGLSNSATMGSRLSAAEREVVKLREELKKERRLKMKAFLKLDQMRDDQGVVTDDMVWQKKYFECASELQKALKDLQVYKDYLSGQNLSHPSTSAPPRYQPPQNSQPAASVAQRVNTLPLIPGDELAASPEKPYPPRASTNTPTRAHHG